MPGIEAEGQHGRGSGSEKGGKIRENQNPQPFYKISCPKSLSGKNLWKSQNRTAHGQRGFFAILKAKKAERVRVPADGTAAL
ncbi:MAG: hypothetical protein ACOX8B_02600 [Lachnospiraceae bacterium]